MKPLSDYRDYRDYLRDVFSQEKKTSHLTLAKFAKTLTMSPSLLKMVMDGQRKLSGDKIHKVARVLNLGEADWDYFESLVRMNDAETEEEKEFYSQRLQSLIDRESVNRIRTDKSEIVKSWYVPALLIYLIDFSEVKDGQLIYDEDHLSRKLHISKKEIREWIELLMSTGLLKLKSEGQVHIVFDKILGTVKKKIYIEQVIDELKKNLRRHSDQSNNIYEASVLTLSDKNIREFKAEYRTLLEKYSSIEEPGKNGRVVQTLMGLFPVL